MDYSLLVGIEKNFEERPKWTSESINLFISNREKIEARKTKYTLNKNDDLRETSVYDNASYELHRYCFNDKVVHISIIDYL